MRVCVVGAGLAGLSVAVAAGGNDVEMTIYERSAVAEALGGGIILQPVATRALLELGCFDEIRSAGAELTCLTQVREGRRIEIQQRDVWPALGLPTVAIHRHLLQAVLLRWASESATVELSREVACLARHEAGAVTVRTADGGTAGFDLAVGADGVQSAIRAQVEPRSEVRPLGLWWARWLVEAGSPIAPEWMTERRGRIGIGTFPLGGGELQVFATIPAEEMEDEQREETIDRLLRESPILRRAREHGCRLIHVGPAREVYPHVWRGDGVVFVGDAAHAMSPTLSAGGALAIEDGLILGRLLCSGRPAASIPGAYETLRKSRLAWMAKVGRAQIRLSQGSPSIASPAEIVAQLAAMYAPLDDPWYLGQALRAGAVSVG
jgi:2-polyprenyl-6-methoxyphenol hydroxylase-like FAD-dependent oxidoreductase